MQCSQVQVDMLDGSKHRYNVRDRSRGWCVKSGLCNKVEGAEKKEQE